MPPPSSTREAHVMEILARVAQHAPRLARSEDYHAFLRALPAARLVMIHERTLSMLRDQPQIARVRPKFVKRRMWEDDAGVGPAAA